MYVLYRFRLTGLRLWLCCGCCVCQTEPRFLFTLSCKIQCATTLWGLVSLTAVFVSSIPEVGQHLLMEILDDGMALLDHLIRCTCSRIEMCSVRRNGGIYGYIEGGSSRGLSQTGSRNSDYIDGCSRLCHTVLRMFSCRLFCRHIDPDRALLCLPPQPVHSPNSSWLPSCRPQFNRRRRTCRGCRCGISPVNQPTAMRLKTGTKSQRRRPCQALRCPLMTAPTRCISNWPCQRSRHRPRQEKRRWTPSTHSSLFVPNIPRGLCISLRTEKSGSTVATRTDHGIVAPSTKA